MWTAGTLVAVGLVGGVATLTDFGWGFLSRFDLAPSIQFEELLLSGILGLGLSVPQFLLIRWATGSRTAATTAWMPTAVTVFVLQDVVSLFWLRNAPDNVAPIAGFVVGVLLTLAQGFLMAEIVGSRRAGLAWVLGMVVIAALSFVGPIGSLYAALSGINVVVAAVAQAAVFGAIYGGITGAAFVAGLSFAPTAHGPLVPNENTTSPSRAST